MSKPLPPNYDFASEFQVFEENIDALTASKTATEASLASTQATLSSTQSTLSSTQSTLSSTQSTLSSTQSALSASQSALTQSQAETAAEVRPHFVCGLSGDKIVTGGDIIHTLDTDQVSSSKNVVVSSAGAVTLSTGGTWLIMLGFGWRMNANHSAQDSIFTHAHIYVNGNRLDTGSARRRHGGDFFGTVVATFHGNFASGGVLTARAEYDWVTPNMTIFQNDPAKPSGSQIPTSQTDGAYPYSVFGGGLRFIGIKTS